MTRLLDTEATRARLPMGALVDALRAMFATGCEVPLRHVHALGTVGTSLLMPAWQEGGLYGVKVVNVFPANGARGLPAVNASYTLFDATTGAVLAVMDGSEITTRRTAVASALAASFLAREDARRLLVVGAGRVASLLPEAMKTVRPGLDEVLVWNRHLEAAAALAARVGGRVAPDLEAAVRAADIVSCATLAEAPLVRGAWLAPGAHLDLIGSFTPSMREADGAAFARARVFVDTEEALAKSGDCLQAMAEGAFDRAALQGTLAGLVRGSAAGRRGPAEITLFKSVGTALEDLAAAALAWQAPR
ncbi:MAG: ornithine cyclodeaminase family protein [Rubrivivax sp.]